MGLRESYTPAFSTRKALRKGAEVGPTERTMDTIEMKEIMKSELWKWKRRFNSQVSTIIPTVIG